MEPLRCLSHPDHPGWDSADDRIGGDVLGHDRVGADDRVVADADTAVRVVNYITDAKKKGLKVGDLVEYYKTDASPPAVFTFIVSAINATTGAGDLSNSTAFTATNTD